MIKLKTHRFCAQIRTFWLIIVLVFSVTIPSESALANWELDSINNQSGQEVTVLVPIGNGETRGSSNLLVRGDIAVDIAGSDIIIFKDIGHIEHPCPLYWAVLITYRDQTWTYYYDGGGLLALTINANNTISLQPINGKVVVGNQTSPC